MPTTIQVFEHEKLTIHEDEFGRSITPKQFEKLCEFNDKNDNKFYTVIRNGVKFANYVGVIQIGSLVIEILPKADKVKLNHTNKEASFDRWRKVLLKMLAISGYLKIDAETESMLKKRINSLLDLYFEIYLSQVTMLIRHGLVKKYRHDSSNVNALKGRINFAKNIQKNLIHQERFYTTHQRYDYEHLINQILLKGLTVLRHLSNDDTILLRVKQLQFSFPEIKEIHIEYSSFEKVNLDRKTEIYSEALKIARMLILNYSPDISKGDENMLALLFDMNLLWEKYIYKRLKQGENGNYEVSYQDKEKFWEKREIRPDLVIRFIEEQKEDRDDDEEEDDKAIILDTKWRLAEPDKPTDDELKQMFAYNIYWKSPKSILLYPKVGDKQDGKYGLFHKGILEKHECKVAFVDILNEKGELNLGVADEIIKKI